MTAFSAERLVVTDVELDMKFGMKRNVIMNILMLVVKSGEPFGTLNAQKTSTMMVAAPAHEIASLNSSISVSHVKKDSTPMKMGFHLSVHQA